MPNESKLRDPRSWRNWADSGSVSYAFLAEKKGLALFNYDPFIGCPFDNSQLALTDECAGFKVGDKVSFLTLDLDEVSKVKGKIVAIGKNAKSKSGIFTIVAIQSGSRLFFKASKEIILL
jgi:hypothetical protein